MLRRLEEYAESWQQPVVVIEHSEDLVNDCEFDRFLASVRRWDEVHLFCVPISTTGCLGLSLSDVR